MWMLWSSASPGASVGASPWDWPVRVERGGQHEREEDRLQPHEWLRRDMVELRRDIRELNGRLDSFAADVTKRFDDVKRELAELRERMAKLEGSLEGLLAGRRDRDVA